MLWKLLVIFALIFEGIDAAKEKKVSFSVGKTWQNYARNNKWNVCASNEPIWQDKVQDYFDGTRKATWKFRGRSYEIADVVMKKFEDYLAKLMYFSNFKPTVLSSSSSALLNSMARCNKLGKSSLIIIREFNVVLPELVKDFKSIVAKLKHVLGIKVSSTFNKAVTDLGDVFTTFMTTFLKERPKKIIYEPVYKSLAFLMNTVALIAETLLEKCNSASTEVQEAVTILSLIFYHFSITVQGISSCVQDYLITKERTIPQNLKVCTKSFEYVLVGIAHATTAVMFPFTKGIKALMVIFVNVAMAFNTAVKDVLGVFEGVSITVQEISQNLLKNVKALKNGSRNVVKGIISK